MGLEDEDEEEDDEEEISPFFEKFPDELPDREELPDADEFPLLLPEKFLLVAASLLSRICSR